MAPAGLEFSLGQTVKMCLTSRRRPGSRNSISPIFEIDGFFAANDIGFRAILANGLTFDNVHFNLIKAYDFDRVDEVYIHNTVVGSDVDAFFGSTVDTTHSFDIMIDGWIQRSSSPYTISGPLLHFQRAVSVVLTGVNYRGLSGVPVAIQFSNDCQGNSITDSTVVNAATGIKLARNTVGSTTSSPGWNRIDNFMCDGCAGIGIDVENGSWFNTITQAYFTTLNSGDTGIILRAGSLANMITGSVFQNMRLGGTGITVEAGVKEFAIADSYFSGIAGSTGSSGTRIGYPGGSERRVQHHRKHIQRGGDVFVGWRDRIKQEHRRQQPSCSEQFVISTAAAGR